ncbi:MarC family protein [Flagellimonas onchidii]|uniref:MarC family protein n=1 Tax=Flagellimonas onchidii TaxID=2562684 RepID=UPI001F0E990D|nr:MarC family protein [Allomuricauda onchidii]
MIIELLIFSFSVFMSFFAINNPIAYLPVFISFVEGKSKRHKKDIAKKATMISFIVVTFFVIFGKYMFFLFGLTIPGFKITGGLILFYVGFGMLLSNKPKINQTGVSGSNGIDIAITPLAVPILAGPGTILTAFNFACDADYQHIVIIVSMFGLISYLSYLSFSFGDIIIKGIGSNFISVIGKLMGLILTINGVGMIISGIKTSFNLI